MIDTSPQLFETPNAGELRDAPRFRWRLVTNTRNLFQMMASGLVTGPAGFGKKYYEDPLSLAEGWVPLVRDAAPRPLLELSVRERPGLRPCLLELDLSSLEGPCHALDAAGSLQEIPFPQGLSGAEVLLLVPAPLPAHWITEVLFEAKEDKSSTLRDAENYANVSLAGLRTRILKKAFAGESQANWLESLKSISPRDDPPARALASGGVMAMLLHTAERGDLAVEASRLAFEPEAEPEAQDPSLRALAAWLRGSSEPLAEDLGARLLWELVEAVSGARFQEGSPEPTAVVLEHLGQATQGTEERLQLAVEQLTSDLRALRGLGEHTVSDLLDRHGKPLSRALVLFFLRQTCPELLDFSHPLILEQHRIPAAMLFGARCGWLGLPESLRSVPGLAPAVSHRMAAMAHHTGQSGIRLGDAPPRPRSVRELLAPGERGWTAKQKEAALLLARAGKWDCIRTRVTLGKGEYRLVVDGSGTHLVFDGEPRAVSTNVDQDELFSRLAAERPADASLRKVRDLLQA